MKKLSLTSFLTSILLATCLSAVAAEHAPFGGFKGNWTQKFPFKGTHYVLHTPTYVNVDGWLQAGEELHLNNLNLNGVIIKNLHLKRDSSREEFVEALNHSNIYSD